MRLVQFDKSQEIPIVDITIYGPRGFEKLAVVFDTGCGTTAIHTPLIENIGYSASDATEQMFVRGPVGDKQSGYVVPIKCLSVFGMRFNELSIAAYDFDNFIDFGIAGLLGFDVIKRLHLEMNGPKGLLKFFSTEDRALIEKASKLVDKEQSELVAEDIQALLGVARLSVL